MARLLRRTVQPVPAMFERSLHRLRAELALGCGFVLAGALLNAGGELVAIVLMPHPESTAALLAHWLTTQWLTSMAGAMIVLIFLRLSMESGRALARQPWRFAVALVSGALAAALTAWAIAALMGRAPPIGSPDLAPKIFNAWQEAMYSGTLVGWLYVLTMRRVEERRAISALLARRSILRRQLTESTLLAHRARVEPETIAQVLTQIRQRHQSAPTTAAALLDHLVNYLRLVMHRSRDRQPSLLSELSLLRSYLRLCEAQAGVPIRCDDAALADAPASAARLPIFLIAKQILALALEGGGGSIALALHWQANSLMLRLELGSGALPPHAATLLARLGGQLQPVDELGTLRYVATFNAV